MVVDVWVGPALADGVDRLGEHQLRPSDLDLEAGPERLALAGGEQGRSVHQATVARPRGDSHFAVATRPESAPIKGAMAQRSESSVCARPRSRSTCASQPSSAFVREGSSAMCCTSPERAGRVVGLEPVARVGRERLDDVEHARLHAAPDVERAGHVGLGRAQVGVHHVADVDVVARLLAVAEDRRAGRPRAACRRRSRSRRPRRAGPGAARRRCRSAARPSTARAGG